MKKSRSIPLLLTLLTFSLPLFLTSLPRTFADTPPDTLSDAASLLGPTYRDEANGFEINPPEGVRLIQKAGSELLSFVHDSKQFGGSIAVSTMMADQAHPDANYAPAEMLRLAAADLNAKAHNVQVIDSRETTVSGKPAAWLCAAIEMDGANGSRVPLIKQQLMVQTAANQYKTLTFFAPLERRDEAIRIFTAMVSTFEILDPAQVAARRAAAVKNAKEWLTSHNAEDLTDKLAKQPRLFRILVDNRDVGYVRYDEAVATRDGYQGILVSSNSRTFPPNDSILMAANESFWAYSKQPRGDTASYSTWNNKTKTTFPNLDPNSTQAHMMNTWGTELGTLQLETQTTQVDDGSFTRSNDYVLTVVRNGAALDLTKGQLKWAIPDKSTPLPKPLEMLWPRLVDLSKPIEMGFVVFNPQTSRMALRVLSIKGPDTILIDGAKVDCIRLADEITPNITTMWVDKNGMIQMIRSSDNTIMLPTTQDAMERLWAPRLSQLH